MSAFNGGTPPPASPTPSTLMVANNNNPNHNNQRIRVGSRSNVTIGSLSNSPVSKKNSAVNGQGSNAVPESSKGRKRAAVDSGAEDGKSAQQEAHDAKRQKQATATHAEQSAVSQPSTAHPVSTISQPLTPAVSYGRYGLPAAFAFNFPRVLALPSFGNTLIAKPEPNPKYDDENESDIRKYIIHRDFPKMSEIIDFDMIVQYVQSDVWANARYTWSDFHPLRTWLRESLISKVNYLIDQDVQRLLANQDVQSLGYVRDIKSRIPQDVPLAVADFSKLDGIRAISFPRIDEYINRLQYFNLDYRLDIVRSTF
jgi:hypothetical protein